MKFHCAKCTKGQRKSLKSFHFYKGRDKLLKTRNHSAGKWLRYFIVQNAQKILCTDLFKYILGTVI